MPSDLPGCHALIVEQATLIGAQSSQLEALSIEMEKLRKLLSHFVNGSRSEKRILASAGQELLPFESDEEFQAASIFAGHAQVEGRVIGDPVIVVAAGVTAGHRVGRRDDLHLPLGDANMHFAPHEGQSPRRLQLKPSGLTWPLSPQRSLRKSCARMPPSRKASNTALGVHVCRQVRRQW